MCCCGAPGDFMVMLVADWSAGWLVAQSVGSDGLLVDSDVQLHDAEEEPALTQITISRAPARISALLVGDLAAIQAFKRWVLSCPGQLKLLISASSYHCRTDTDTCDLSGD